MFEETKFIKSSAVNDSTRETYAPMFRRKFCINNSFNNAKLIICGLGYAYSYINEMRVSDDLFTAPISNYTKTLWYSEYDVTELLNIGENIFAAVCGNGWYNEVIHSTWGYENAPWNDTPKLIMRLEVDGEPVLSSDEKFKVTIDTPYIFNQLRSGEHFDSRKYNKQWKSIDFDDSSWENAIYDNTPPLGVFRKCECEPIHECKLYPAINVKQIDDEAYVFDFGQNMSGYVRIDANQPSGTELVIKYAELMNDDNTRNINKMDHYYKESEIETDHFICNGERFVWSPKFTYHGFNYVIIEGIKDISKINVTGVFVHQDIVERANFECSDATLNQLYECGKISSYSNMFYQLTDCPTREKLGWLNDARASAKQMMINFEMERFFGKWIVDIADAMLENGSLPGIAPTCGWGYEWGNGPVSDGVLFEIPYQVYINTGDWSVLKNNIPYFEKYLNYLDTRKDDKGYISFGLPDWAAPNGKTNVPVELINACLEFHFAHITEIALNLSRNDGSKYRARKEAVKKLVMTDYIDNGFCKCNEQTAVAMLIYYGFYNDLEPLKQQLKKLLDGTDSHHNCGMVGLRHLYYALSICGLDDYAFEILTKRDYPSQGYWLELGANTLWECWEPRMSRNHHMYSDFMAWVFESILGIKCNEEHPGYTRVDINPTFINKLTFAKGYVNTVSGKLEVSWNRTENSIQLCVTVPNNIEAYYKGSLLAKKKI